MCPHFKVKPPAHPLLDDSFFNTFYIKCVRTITHDVLTFDNPYIICTDCYNPSAYNRVMTHYTHSFQYGNVPNRKCAHCKRFSCSETQPLFECTACIKAYFKYIQLVHKANEEHIYRRLIGISIESISLEVDYAVIETRVDPNDPEVLDEMFSD